MIIKKPIKQLKGELPVKWTKKIIKPKNIKPEKNPQRFWLSKSDSQVYD